MLKKFALDILLVHGLSIQLVADLKEFFESFDLRAAAATNETAGGNAQKEKVDKYIKGARLAVVLATFDEENPASGQARPNVIHELGECHRILKKRVLVLVEERNGKRVQLPSNLNGHLSEIVFSLDSINKLYPRLVKELREAGLIFSERSSDAPKSVVKGRVLNKFLDRMDSLWDNEIDEVSPNIRRDDFETWNEFADLLDRFFLIYWELFDAVIRKSASPDKVEELTTIKFNEALSCTENAWGAVAKANMRYADELKVQEEGKNRSRIGEFRKHYDAADAEIRALRRKRGLYERIESHRKVIKHAAAFIKALE